MREVKECAFDRASTKAYMVREWVEAEHGRCQVSMEIVSEHTYDKRSEWSDGYVEESVLKGKTPGELQAWEEKLRSAYERLCDLSDELESGVTSPAEVHAAVSGFCRDFKLELNVHGTRYFSRDDEDAFVNLREKEEGV